MAHSVDIHVHVIYILLTHALVTHVHVHVIYILLTHHALVTHVHVHVICILLTHDALVTHVHAIHTLPTHAHICTQETDTFSHHNTTQVMFSGQWLMQRNKTV